jgi:uncharacterized membrane protein YdjX (TVP38/TMEM64 family)
MGDRAISSPAPPLAPQPADEPGVRAYPRDTPATGAGRGPATRGRAVSIIRAACWLVIAASALIVLRSLPLQNLLDIVQKKVATLGPWGPIAFGAAYFLAAVLFVPGSALTLTAGAIFGPWVGTATVSIASTAAAGASFLIARYIARERIQRLAEANRTFGAIDRAIARGDWRIVALLRLSPVVPFSMGNYLFGLTPARFWPYLLASWVAMLPGTFLYVSIGFAGRAAVALAPGAGPAEANPWRYATLATGLLATVVVSVYITRLARKALRETLPKEDGMPSASNAATPPTAPTRTRPVGRLVAVAGTLAVLAACAHLYKGRLGSMFGPPKATLREVYASTQGGDVFDHSAFDALLRAHVSATGGFVDYDALRKDASALDAYIAAIGKAEISRLGRDERLALLINAYNAFTLRLILDHYPIDSIKDIPARQRWDARRWVLAGETFSLNQIEHQLIRPRFAEPRVHFALVCAAIGCPPLRNEAYTGSRLEEQLADQARFVHSHPRWFRLDPSRGELLLTPLYDWYADDFAQKAPSVVAYAAQFSPELVRLINAGREPRVAFLDYNWKLNSVRHRTLAEGE